MSHFRLDERQLPDSRSMLKCSRCQRLFPAPVEQLSAGSRTPPAPQRDDDFSFSFADDEEWREEPFAASDLPEEQFSLNIPPAASTPTHGAAPVRGGARPEPPDDAEEAEEIDDDECPEEDFDNVVSGSGSISLRPVFVFLVLVISGYGLLAWTLNASPYWARRITRNLPVIGNDIRDRTLNQSVALIGVQGHYERTKEGKLLFLVSGKAVNQSADSLNNVRILFKLFDEADRAIGEQLTSCGTPIELKELRNLSAHQIAILKSIKPGPEFRIRPGTQCPFVSIFVDAPATVEAFSAQVVGAQRHV